MKPQVPMEYPQRRDHLTIVAGNSVVTQYATMPYFNEAKESVLSMSRRLVTLMVRKSRLNGAHKSAL